MSWLFHKVDLIAPTPEWVTAKFFKSKIAEIRQHGWEVVPLSHYTGGDNQLVITFDGVYENVYLYAFPILKELNYPFELFVTGKYIGGDNKFDWPETFAKFASKDQLAEMAKSGGIIEYHSWSHSDLTKLNVVDIEAEIRSPFAAKFFAYPYGRYNQKVKEVVQKYYQGAVSVDYGDNSKYELIRQPIWEKSASLFLVTIMGRIWRKLLRAFWLKPANQ